MIKLFTTRKIRLAIAAFLLVAARPASAQLTGVKSIPGDYPTIAAAVADLNLQSVGAGGVTFNVNAGHTETASNIVLTATGTASDQIVFQRSGVGPNPVITASTGTGTLDGIIILSGADYVTFDGIDLSEAVANTTSAAQMEWGYALLKASATQGCQYNTIKNCVITLNRANTASIGIWLGNHTTAASTSVTLTAVTGANSFNKIHSNTITNTYSGVIANGFADVSPYTFYDIANEIGGTLPGTGNTINNYGGTSTTSYGVRTIYQNGLTVANNTIANAGGGGVTGAGILYGIMVSTGTNSSATITRNVLTLTQGSVTNSVNVIYSGFGGTGSVTITDNVITGCSTAGSSSTFNGITLNSSPATVTVTGNNISGNSTNATGSIRYIDNAGGTTVTISNNRIANNTAASTGTIYGIYNSTSASSIMAANNTVTNITRTGTGAGTFYGYYNNGSPTTGMETITADSVSNITQGGTSTFYGIYTTPGSGQSKTITSNVVNTISSGSGACTGIHSTLGNVVEISMNKVYGISSAGTTYGISSAGVTTTVKENLIYGLTSSSNVGGIVTNGGTTLNIFRNKIYDLSTSGTATPTVYGVYSNSGTTVNIANNLIGDLRDAAGTGLSPVSGIYVNSPATNIYYNTIYLNASSSGANFGTSGIYFSTTPAVDIRNNIVINNSTASGTGVTAALRRAGVGTTNLASTSNNNIYYAGTPSATNTIFYDGTTAYQTLASYQSLVAPREGSSQTENTLFLSTSGFSSGFLHIDPSVNTRAESGAAAISGYTDDYDMIGVRTGYPLAGQLNGGGTAPDIGADEGDFKFIPLADVGITGLASPLAGSGCRTTENISVVIKNYGNGTHDFSVNNVIVTVTITGPNPMTIVDTITGGTLAPGASSTYPMMTGYNMGAFGTYVFSATTTMAGDASGANDAMSPLTIVTSALSALASANPDTICAGSSSQLSAGISGTVNLGTGTITNGSTGYPTPYGNYYYGVRHQFLVPASELSAAGLIAGPITSLAFDVSNVNSSPVHNGFEIKMGATNLTSITTFQGGLTTVAPGSAYQPVLGWNNHSFTTPFLWDGTSNVIVEVCFNNTGYVSNGNASVRQSATAYSSTVYYREDAAGVCSNTSVTSTFLQRPNMRFSGNTISASVTWSPTSGLSNAGIYNPVAMPTSTMTYTATVTSASGCMAQATVTVNVNPLPSSPVATNSTQCGPGIPAASVTGTGTMLWYSASTGGTLLQNGGNTYTTSITVSDTFYVGAFDGSCESPRTQVIAEVTSSSPITALVGTSTICAGQTSTLTVSSSNTAYNYTWSPAASLNTANNDIVIASPATTTTYTVSASDNVGCTAGASVVVNVNPLPSATPSATPAAICPGQSTQLNATVTLPQVGTGSIVNSNTTYPAPYGNYYYGARHQFLITAAELTAAGLVAGPIDSLAFEVTNTNGSPALNGFEIKMGATALASISSFQTGLTTVAFNGPYQPVVGWNTHTFSTPFAWDGLSNVIIETCFNNTNYVYNASVKQSATSYVSSVFFRDDAAGVCSNSTVTGTASQRPNMRFGSAVTYSWSPSASLSSSTIENPVATPMTTITYTVSVTNTATGCSAQSFVEVTVNPGAVAGTISGPSAVCPGATATLNITGNTGNIQWYSAPDNDAFTPIAGGTSTTLVTPAVTDTTYFAFIATNGTCTDTSMSHQVNLLPAVNAVANSTAAACNGSASGMATVSAGTGSFTYSWNTTPVQTNDTATGLTAGTYQVVVTSLDGCTDTATVVVTEPTSISTMMSTVNASCNGSSDGSAMAFVSGGTPGYSYSWSAGTGSGNIVSNLAGGVYFVQVTDANGCTDTAQFAILDPAPLDITVTGNMTICGGDTATLTASGANSYSWSTGDMTASVNVMPASTANYTVSGTDSNGCTDVDTVTVTVNQAPVAGFTYNTLDGLTFDFTANTADNYSWNFGDLTTGNLQNESHTFSPGTYSVELIVSNACGSDTTSSTIVAIGERVLSGNQLASLYPNPSKGDFTLEINTADKIEVISILDMEGRIVIEEKGVNASIFKKSFHLSAYAKGVYSVKIVTSERTEILRFVLN